MGGESPRRFMTSAKASSPTQYRSRGTRSGRLDRTLPAKLLGWGFAGAGLVLVVRALISGWPEVSQAIDGGSYGWMVAAILLATAAMLQIALVWFRVLRLLGSSTSCGRVVAWYFVGELGKYLPGSVWALIGRSELAVREETPRGRAYGSVVLGLFATFGCAGLYVVVLAPIQFGLGVGWVVIGGLAGAIAVAGLHPGIIRTLLAPLVRLGGQGASRLPRLPPWRGVLELLTLSVPIWLGIGAATWCVGAAMGVLLPFTEVLFAVSLAWLVGFVVVVAPGGLGVREATFAWALWSASPGVAAAVALGARFVFVLADLVGAAAGILVLGKREPHGVPCGEVDAPGLDHSQGRRGKEAGR